MYLFKELDMQFNMCMTKDYSSMKTGTTIVAAIADNAVVFGADTQGTLGYMKTDLSENIGMSKVTKLNERLGFSLCGSASAISILAGYFKKFIAIYERETTEYVTPSILAKNLRYHLQRRPTDGFAILIYGWNVTTETPELYSVWGDGFLEQSTMFVLGSGTPYAKGYLSVQYHKLKHKNIENIKSIVKNAVKSSTSTDLFSGFSIDIGHIDQTHFEISRFSH